MQRPKHQKTVHKARQQARERHVEHCKMLMRKLAAIVHRRRQGLTTGEAHRETYREIQRVVA